jgi:hypothetical protein
MRQKLSFQGVFLKGHADLPFRYLPFEVPAGARRLEVSYHFERAEREPSDVVDIGVFDARGTDFLNGGFRGWSGSARSGFFLTPQDAAPGYIRGPLGRGLWHLLLGCPLLHGDRCRYWVELSLDVDPDADTADAPADPEAPAAGPARSSPSQRGAGRWYAGDLHCHSVHSDGLNTVDECAAEAARQGLDFLAITDHNTVAHFEEIAARPDDGVLLIPGEEVTTAWGHANVWGLGRWVDFRCTDDPAMQRVLDFVGEQGGIFSVNHPKRGYPWEFAGVEDFRMTEVWQGPWRFYNTESLDFWEQRLQAGRRLVAVGGSDCHAIPPAEEVQPWPVGNPCTRVYVEGPLDEEGVLGALRAGHVFISEDPKGPFLELTATCGERSYLMGDLIEAPAGTPMRFCLRYRGPAEKKLRLLRDGEVWQQVVADREEMSLEFESSLEEPGYVRAEVMGFRGRPERGEVVHAMTNPLYLSLEET